MVQVHAGTVSVAATLPLIENFCYLKNLTSQALIDSCFALYCTFIFAYILLLLIFRFIDIFVALVKAICVCRLIYVCNVAF